MKMAKSLNSKCDFKQGFFTCDIPKGIIQLTLKIQTRQGKHTLVEDREKRTEKYRPIIRQTPGLLPDSSATSDSGPWQPEADELRFTP